METSNTLLYIGIIVAISTAALIVYLGFKPGPHHRPSGINVNTAIRTPENPGEYLLTLPKWDGVRRIDRWLTTYLGDTHSEYTSRAGEYFLLGMIARALDPGCRFEKLLLLVGQQGGGKSEVLRTLAGAEWFSDTEIDLGCISDIANLHGKWLHEFSEIGSMHKSEAAALKQFITHREDIFRAPYSHRPKPYPRSIVFAGSTSNDEWVSKNKNRRFLPVNCIRVDIEGLKRDRDQLFAEALKRYSSDIRALGHAEIMTDEAS